MTTRCKDTKNNRNARRLTNGVLLPPDWTTLDITEPFLHPRTNKYNIAVETQHPNPGGGKLPKRLQEAKVIGVEALLEVYNKVSSREIIDTLLSVAETPEHFVPERPNPSGIVCFGLKVLVTVSKLDFDLIPFKEDENIPDEPLPIADREITLVSSAIRRDIFTASNILEGIAKQIRDSGSVVTNINLDREATKLRKFVFTLERHLTTNGYHLKREQQDLILIGIDNAMKPLYVLIDDGEGLVRLSIRFMNFVKDDPINRPITIEYISNLDKILLLEQGRTDTTWSELLNNLSENNKPSIKPNVGASAGIGAAIKIADIIKTFDTRGQKTEEEKEEEDRQLLSADFKTQIFVNNKEATDFVGDVLVDNFESSLEKINSLEDVYQEVLDKFGVQCLVAFLIKCLENAGLPDPCTLGKSLLRNADCGKFTDSLRNDLGLDPFDNEDMRNEFRTRAIDCISRMSSEEKLNTFSRLNSHEEVTIRVNGISDIGNIPVRPLAEVLGMTGERIFGEACDATRDSLVDSIPDDCFGSEIELFLPNLCEFKIPTINLPDFLPTLDIMGFITVQIETAILDALVAALVDTIKQIIRGILNCGDFSDVSFGEIPSLGDLVSVDAGASIGAGIGGVADVTTNLLTNLNIGLDDSPGERLGRAQDLEVMMDSLFTVLTPSEFGNLLNGNPNDETRKIIRCLVGQKHQGLKSAFDEPTKVDNFFENLGNLVNKQDLLEQMKIQEGANFAKLSELCDAPFDDIRKNLLEDKGLTPKEIDDQLAMARQRRADQLADLINLLDKEDILDGVVPPVFCKRDSQGNVTKGLIPRDPPSYKFMLNKAVDVIYDGVHMSFNQEIANFAAALIEPSTTTTITTENSVPKVITSTFVDETTNEERTEEILNPEYSRLIAQGISTDDSEPFNKDSDADDLKVERQDVFSDSAGQNFVAKGLRDALRNIEFDDKLFEVDGTTRRARFIVPLSLDPTNLQFAADRLPGFLRLQEALQKLQDISQGKNTIVGYVVDYIMGTDDDIDNYSFAIGKKFGDDRVEETFRFDRSAPIEQKIQNFIENKELQHAPETATQEGKFAHFMAKIWANGGEIYKNENSETPVEKPDYARGLGSNEDTINRILSTSSDGVRGIFHGENYYQLFRDYYAKFSKEVSDSPLFRSNVVSLIDFLQIPLDDDGLPTPTPGCNPHLLDLDKIKKQMKEDYFASECEDDLLPSTDGLGTGEPNPLERSGIGGAVLTFIRLYVIELILRSIFVFSEIKASRDEKVDDLISEYFSIEAQRDLEIKFQERDPEFFFEFSKEAVSLYNKRVKKGEIEGPELDNTQAGVAFSFFIQEQLTDVNEKIASIVGSKDATTGTEDNHKKLLREWIPLFDVPNNPNSDTNEARFGVVNPFALFISTNVRTGEQLDSDNQHVFNLENGNFILERYLRIEDLSDSERSERAGAREFLEQASFTRASTTSQKVIDRPNHMKGVVEIKGWNSFIAKEMRDNLSLQNTFKSISYGLRLVYLPKVNKKPFLRTLQGASTRGEVTEATSEEEGLVFNEILEMSEINRAQEREKNKAFDINEKFVAEKTDIARRLQKKGKTKGLAASDLEVQRNVFPVPLVSVEIDADLQELDSNFVGTGPDDNIFMDGWINHSTRLEEMLRKTPEYNFIFRYCIPIDRMNTLAIIYCTTYLSSNKKIRELFDGTKQALKTVFQTLQNSGDYRYEDSYVQDLGGNAGAMKLSQNTANTEPEVEGMSLAAIAARTPLLILKGLVEITDTNIGRARKIVDAAKAEGKDIPMLAASLGQIPMNVIPPPPFGPGIGAPISSLGFLYLALGIDSIFETAQGKKVAREDLVNSDVNIDLQIAGKEIAKQCDDNDSNNES